MTEHVPGKQDIHAESARYGQVWERVCSELRGIMGEDAYSSWMEHVDLRDVAAGTATLTAPTQFICNQVQQRYGGKIREVWTSHAPEVRRIAYEVSDARPVRTNRVAAESIGTRASMLRRENIVSVSGSGRDAGASGKFQSASDLAKSAMTALSGAPTGGTGGEEPPFASIRLNEQLTFERFVESRSNRAAKEAAMLVAEQDVVMANPLVLHGGPGSGKTHILHALVRRRRERFPREKVLFISAEAFLMGFVKALRFDDMARFKHEMRNVDLLVIDDFRHIVGRIKTEEEFLNTIAALMDEGRQVVIAADRAPAEILEINARLRSRMRDGMPAHIQPADVELRRAILAMRAEEMSRTMPDIVIDPKALDLMAERLGPDLRALNGAFNKLCLQARTEARPVTVSFAQNELAFDLRERDRRLTMEETMRVVAEHFGLKPGDLESKCRERQIVRPRQIAMWLCRRLVDRSYPEIGKKFGDRNHATVIHAVKKVEQLREMDSEFHDEVDRIRRKLEGGSNDDS